MKKIFKIAIVALAIVATGAATANAAFNANLSVGATGADVSALQSWLISKGFAIPSISSGAAMPGYFGQQTKSAVVAYQASVGLPATGFVGPLTRGILNGSPVVGTTPTTGCPVGFTCTANPGTTPTTPSTGSLVGTDGTISDVSKLSQYNNEEIGDGESDVKIVGFEVEASNDGDIALRSVNLTFDGSTNVGSTRLSDYVDTVKVWQDSTEIGSADASDFNKDSSGVYSKTVSLKSGSAVVRADKKSKFYITVDAVSNLDSTDISSSNDAWSVDVNNIRFEDGSGVVTSDTDSGDLGASLDNVTMSFVNFSTAADTELKISKDSSSPVAGIVVVDDTDNTDGVTLFVGKIKVEGTSDVTIDQLPVTLTVTGATDVDAVTGNVTLKIDGNDYDESVSTSAASATVIFDNLDLTLDAGKTYTFTVTADINDIDAGPFDEGDALVASLTSTNRDYIDAENSEGDQLSDSSEKSGTVTGEGQEFRTNGIALTLVSNTPSPIADNAVASNDLGTFVLKFKVTAIGDSVYISTLADATLSGVTAGKTSIVVDRAGTATVGGVSSSIRNITDTTVNTAGLYEIADGESETFELTTTVQLPAAGAAGVYHAVLGGVSWTTDSTDATPNNAYTSELDGFVVTGTLN